jgi:alpha-tubulin suppressor-like RCC1 family protein
MEEKAIVYVTCGLNHVMAVDSGGRLYGWGEGEKGCLGLGDSNNRIFPVPISFFEDKRVIDVSCGERFTVVIAEIYEEDNLIKQAEYSEIGD